MTRTLTLEIPEDVERALQEEADRTGASYEQFVTTWLRQRAKPPQRGTVDAIMPYFGALSMAPEEREKIERMIEEERLLQAAV